MPGLTGYRGTPAESTAVAIGVQPHIVIQGGEHFLEFHRTLVRHFAERFVSPTTWPVRMPPPASTQAFEAGQ